MPAELIGRYFTGQTAAVVGYYAVVERDALDASQAHQAMAMRELSLRGDDHEFEKRPASARFIKADEINSKLSQSLRKNVPETLITYGCISISVNEGAESGLDVLRETRGINAAANKTEICPYGNHCPPEIIRMLGGSFRCALCPYAVRSIDHLPAVLAEQRRVLDTLDETTKKIQTAESLVEAIFSDE